MPGIEKFDSLLARPGSGKRLIKSKLLTALGATGVLLPWPQNTERLIERKILLQNPVTHGPPPAPPVTLLTSIAAYWAFESSPGSVTPDSTGNGNSLTLVGTASSVIPGGIIGDCYEASSSTDVCEGVAASTELAATDSFTLTGWINPAVGFNLQANNYIAGRMQTTNPDYELIWNNSNGFEVGVVDTNGVFHELSDGTTSISLGSWYFLACGFDFSNSLIFFQLNAGARLLLTGVPNVRNTPIANFSIANTSTPTSAAMPGKVDEVGFWKRVLTTTEISTLYNSGSAKTYPFS